MVRTRSQAARRLPDLLDVVAGECADGPTPPPRGPLSPRRQRRPFRHPLFLTPEAPRWENYIGYPVYLSTTVLSRVPAPFQRVPHVLLDRCASRHPVTPDLPGRKVSSPGEKAKVVTGEPADVSGFGERYQLAYIHLRQSTALVRPGLGLAAATAELWVIAAMV